VLFSGTTGKLLKRATGTGFVKATAGVYSTVSSIVGADLANSTVSYAKIQQVSATDRVLGRQTAGAGDIEEITCTAAGRALIDDASADLQRATIYAASYDALAFDNILLNSDHIVSQANVDTAVAVTATDVYITDQWRLLANGAAVLSGQRSQSTPPSGFLNFLRVTTTTADASVAAGDRCLIYQTVEGLRFARCGFGAAGAQSCSIGFWVRSNITGTFGVSLMNAAQNRSNVAALVINAANTWEYKTVTFTGDTAGTWVTTNAVSVYIVFALMAGSTFQTGSPNTWVAAGNHTTAAQTNFVATNANTFDVTGAVLIPGAEVPASARSALLMRPFQVELPLCQRYYYKTFPQSTVPAQAAGQTSEWIFTQGFGATAGNQGSPDLRFPVQMRATPTVTTYNPLAPNAQVRNLTRAADASALSNNVISELNYSMTYTTAVGSVSGDINGLHIVADARM
jgi:hypothetical protein